ncbi:hypothetical protein Daesc_002345 [Daldinia eschscholtzii]|uniref:Alpha-L-rhamnosidase C-terminal domain-containing protein n=1 Tax=Daldinia eschscholtzii TaxID=292717 RepID=A0AAX6MWL6_9PEZI
MASHPLLFTSTLIVWVLVFLGDVSAQTCWRDTKCTGAETTAFPGEWESNIFAPSSRTVTPKAVFRLDTGESISIESTSLTSTNSGIYYDFGLEVGGVVTIQYSVLSTDDQGALGIAFTEAKDYIGPVSDKSADISERNDGALYANFSSTGNHTYEMPTEQLRGGFRYMTLFLTGAASSVTVTGVSLEISFQPTWSNLRAYQGYFHSSDHLLNKIWYSGAYTLQTNALHPLTGRAWPAPESQWLNNGDIGVGDTINTDGAKRDRTVWPGDMGVAVPASFYSTGDIEWTMIGTYNYVLYSGDVDFIRGIWTKYLLAMSFVRDQLDPSIGLLNITGYTDDWGRFNVTSTQASVQVLYYRTLITGSVLATWIGDTTGINSTWFEAAVELRGVINAQLWDEKHGAFHDSLETRDGNINLHPQDGNALAVLFGVVNATSDRAQDISSSLTKNWTPIGAESPELTGEVSTFISSFEIQAHLLAGQAKRALDLIRTSWGWYLNNENGTQSTMVEGYLVDGTWGYRHDAGYEEDYSYTSHSHGWATGPVTALTEYILGLSITGLAGSTWQIAPQFGDLSHAEGGFTTRLGKYFTSWTVNNDGSYTLEYSVPEGTSGVLLLPTSNRNERYKVLVDGKEMPNNSGNPFEAEANGRLRISGGTGGQHRIEVS